MIYHLLLCLGDSLTFGARDEVGRNYPLELGSLLSQMTGEEWYCVTEATNGRTSSELARDAYAIVSRYPDVFGVLLLIGTNDSRCGTPIDIYRDNIEQIVRVCEIHRKKVYLISIPDVSYHRHFLWYDEAAAKLIDEYNAILQAISPAQFIDIRQVIDDKALIDGVHLSHEGNLKLAKYLAGTLLHKDRGTANEHPAHAATS